MQVKFRNTAMILLLSAGALFGQDVPSPDNTARNKRDSMESSVTAEKQGNKKEDRQLLQPIRKQVIADRTLSLYAHNVKIIVQNGTVTLRGPVRSAAEKERISQLSSQAGAKRVNNLIEVVAPPGS